MSTSWHILDACHRAVQELIPTNRRRNDKEFHFQNWILDRIHEVGLSVHEPGRNTYPDFSLIDTDEAYEVKGITAGSRETSFDSNSALPAGTHRGKSVFYVFGRYQNELTGGEAPLVLDVAIVHGSFLNAGPGFVADNQSMRVMGSYGHILLRDRKMYVPQSPYRLLTNLRGHCTLILPADMTPPKGSSFATVGAFERRESEQILVGYRADLVRNSLEGEFAANPNGGRVHPFVAYRTHRERHTPPVELTP